MCKYCDFLENGDCGDDWTTIISTKYKDSGAAHIDASDLSVSFNGAVEISGQLDVYVYREPDNMYTLTADVTHDFEHDRPAVRYAFPINFCPMCGKKLADADPVESVTELPREQAKAALDELFAPSFAALDALIRTLKQEAEIDA